MDQRLPPQAPNFAARTPSPQRHHVMVTLPNFVRRADSCPDWDKSTCANTKYILRRRQGQTLTETLACWLETVKRHRVDVADGHRTHCRPITLWTSQHPRWASWLFQLSVGTRLRTVYPRGFPSPGPLAQPVSRHSASLLCATYALSNLTPTSTRLSLLHLRDPLGCLRSSHKTRVTPRARLSRLRITGMPAHRRARRVIPFAGHSRPPQPRELLEP